MKIKNNTEITPRLTGRRTLVAVLVAAGTLAGATAFAQSPRKSAALHRPVRDARYELAKHYLLDASLDLAETAYLLGYEDPNSSSAPFANGRVLLQASGGLRSAGGLSKMSSAV